MAVYWNEMKCPSRSWVESIGRFKLSIQYVSLWKLFWQISSRWPYLPGKRENIMGKAMFWPYFPGKAMIWPFFPRKQCLGCCIVHLQIHKKHKTATKKKYTKTVFRYTKTALTKILSQENMPFSIWAVTAILVSWNILKSI